MRPISRRKLAGYAVDELISGASPTMIAHQISSELIRSGRKDEYVLLAKDIYQTLESRGLSTTVSVSSAHKLSQPSKGLISAFTASLTKTKHVQIDEVTDESLIGGLKLQTANLTWDNSVANRLSKLNLGSENV